MYITDLLTPIIVVAALLGLLVWGYWEYVGKDIRSIWKKPGDPRQKVADTIIVVVIALAFLFLFNVLF